MEVAASILSRVTERLSLLVVREPAVLIGVAEPIEWIELQLRTWAPDHLCYFTEKLVDIAYDVEDIIEDLIFKVAVQGRRGGVLEQLVLFIRNLIDQHIIHKKLEGIKVRISSLQRKRVFQGAISIEEIDWLISTHHQNMANTVASPVIEKITALLAQETLYSEVKKRARRIQDEFRFLDGFLKNLESKELDDKGMVWMEELCQVSCSAVDVIGLFINRREQLGRSWIGPLRRVVLAFDSLRSQHKLGMEMDKIKAKLLDISTWRPRDVTKQRQWRVPESTFRVLQQPPQEANIISFDDDVHAMMTRLLSDDKDFCAISIVGIEGIGKTTLAKLVYDHDAIVNHFPYRVWASASDGPFSADPLTNIMTELMSQLMGYNQRAPVSWWSEMRQVLKAFLADKRFLIVVDDFIQDHILEEFVTAFLNTSRGSRMILTTRGTTPSYTKARSPPSYLKTMSVHHGLRLRGDDESWALFTHVMKVNIPPELLELRREIVIRCGGLPLAIVRLADVLSQKDANIDEWSSVLQQLDQDQEQVWSKALSKISEDLPLYKQRCLFYFGLFPKDYEIPVRRLIMLWVAEGLVQPEVENEDPEDVAGRCLIELIAEDVVQVTKKKLDGNVKTCRLPYALRQHWLSKAQQATFVQVYAKTRSELSISTGLVRRLVDHLDKEDFSFDHIHGDYNRISTSLRPHYQDVVSFISFDTQEGNKPGEDVGKFLHGCISSSCFLLLRVLDLEHVFRPKLPEALGKLTRLRYLGLRWTFLEMLPSSICKLQNLQTLDLKHTYISTLPSSIWKMQHLRHMLLSESYWSRFTLQPRVCSLIALQTLWGLFVDEKTPVKGGLDRLVNVRKLGLACRLMPSQQQTMLSQLEAVAKWVLKLKHLHTLRLKSGDEENQPWDLDLKPLSGHVNLSSIYLLGRLKNPSIVSEFPRSLSDLTLSGSGLMEDPMLKLDKLPNLKILRLLAKSYTGKLMLCPSGGFPQLRVLKIWKLEQLEEWNVEEGALQALRDLEIRTCIRLKMLPKELLHRSLLELKLTDMPSQFTA
ncbi:putative disease resistance RPP13-like protein 2 [Vitis vinifera]|uniref:Putative disease resistance RPP13-like protein 2 n=1 Tax=Vitis vinifera TaxID=29760 RepID=A0A438CVJ0_VITVI|nr:putative disease resistance RPP13-like protein 2 [Vitis vinifera]RVW73469.1 putative disease resistance RPP13-like protein 2 [Vitis vinifera]